MSTTTRLEELKHDLAQGAGGERAKPDPPVRRWQRARAAQLTGIGACSDAVLGFFDWETKDYRKIPITEQVEVVSLLGDIALGADGKPAPASTRRRQPRRRHRNGRPSDGSVCSADVGGGADRVAPAPAQAEGCRERAGAHRSRGIAAMSDGRPPVKTATEARQGRTTGVVRWVLGVSLTLAIVAMIVAFVVS